MNLKAPIMALSLLFGALPAVAEESKAEASKDFVITSDIEDPELVAASAEARRSLSRFWELAEAGDGSEFALQVALLAPNDKWEMIWVDRVRRVDGKFYGRVAVDPVNFTDLFYGDNIEFAPELIRDWGLKRNGRRYGYFTTRVQYKHFTPEMLAADADFKNSLADGLP